MACRGRRGDYQCEGWKRRAASIRSRDGNRCRDCHRRGRGLHVHHKFYGWRGFWCGGCVLLSVPDSALVTLCQQCHDIRHGRRLSRWQIAIVAALLIVAALVALFG